MEGLCAELHHHKFHPSHQLYKKSLRDIDIPPRKLLSRRSTLSSVDSDVFDSPKSGFGPETDTLFQKFLPYNSLDDDDADPYSSDHFRMYEFKVRRCTRSRSHDWTDCPFAHPGEKARRRDPRRFHYSGTVCSEFRKGNCSRGDNCEFAHGVFECWLHPSRYRTEACKDGKNCKRKVCFFAHTPRQLRVLPPSCHDSGSSPSPRNSPVDKKYRNLSHCCVFCHSVSASPTSTLIGMSHISPPVSPSFSPPLSPAHRTQFSSPVSRYTDRFGGLGSVESSSVGQMDPTGLMSYKDALTELVSSLEAMNVNHEPVSSPASASHQAHFDGNLPWLDVNFSNNNGYDDQQQFLLSPSTPLPSPISNSRSKFYAREFPSPSPISTSRLSFVEEPNNNSNNSATNKYYSDNGLGGGPDLGWVNDLLT
ncbi:Zinc finger CCCH domain-containing protein 49 [Capsicum annuum]|uniref:zinc finger CCCH domain-containing protein 2 n=1 Tax=Capsicum annuum TaxID=4072 RepID=UPI0007BEC068|nr:zinc finger CCCH domain-containing protein 2 [Capsicum annuum]KAF3641405.1 Zinc finger CCCH domain-containing protein 49 [Capsicum annuum]KAF3666320.1 Zinc finger CCCH domain-containing protein 49 [Capsicum annuum]